MGWSEIKEISSFEFVHIGNHSHTHEYLIDQTNEDKPKKHRDGSSSVYKRDPFGNIYELIKYKEEE